MECIMKASSRNAYTGKIIAITPSAIADEIAIQLESGDIVYSQISHASTVEMGLDLGRQAVALVKATEILVLTENEGYKLSNRSQFTGKIIKLTRGFVTAEVLIETPTGLTVNATVTLDGVNRLRLERGHTATATFKASNVVLAVAE